YYQNLKNSRPLYRRFAGNRSLYIDDGDRKQQWQQEYRDRDGWRAGARAARRQPRAGISGPDRGGGYLRPAHPDAERQPRQRFYQLFRSGWDHGDRLYADAGANHAGAGHDQRALV